MICHDYHNMQFLTIILSLLWCTLGILGNVEKTIFLTPPPISLLPSRLNLDDLHLESLSLSNRSLRRQIPAVFPSTLHPHGTETWLRLEGLKEQQRYEVRICWAATVSLHCSFNHSSYFIHFLLLFVRLSFLSLNLQQPTSFSLDIFDLDHVFQTQSLIFSLAGYAEHRQLITETRYDGKNNPNLSAIKKSTTLLLRVLAAADYYSSNATLMQNVPPVNVDISKEDTSPNSGIKDKC